MVLMKLKWNKLTFDNVEVHAGMTVDELKQQVLLLTNVPKDRQKLMCKGGWTAILKDSQDLSQCKLEDGMQIMLMGTADTIAAPTTVLQFVEEMDTTAKAVAGTLAPPGLSNLGNTCYMNSVLQCIRAIPQVKEALQVQSQTLAANQPHFSSTQPIVNSLRNLLIQLETSGAAVTPFQFVAGVRQTFPQFNEMSRSGGGYSQQDAEEFYSALNSVLSHDDRVRRAYNDAMELALEEKLECTESTTEPAVVRGDTAFKLICNIQGGAGTSLNVDYMRDGIKLGLETTIEKFSDVLQRNAVYKKTMRVTNLPKCLCVQFMRFFWKLTPESREHAGLKCKIMRQVAFHDKFDIYEFCSESLQAQIRSAREAEGNETGVYQLVSLVSHKGRSADSGHYIGYARQQTATDKWWVFDDDRVSEMNNEDILKLSGGGDRDMAYLLFFRHLG